MASRYVLARLVFAYATTACLAAAQPTVNSADIPNAERPVSLADAAERRRPDLLPVLDGENVVVEGTVSAAAVRIIQYSHLPLQDASGNGLTIEHTLEALPPWQPGDRLRIHGVVGHRAGLPVVRPTSIRKLGSTQPPAPIEAKIGELNSDRHLGRLVTVVGSVLTTSENSGGDLLLIGSTRSGSLRVFLPQANAKDRTALAKLRSGDTVRVTGIGSQYCPLPPYNRLYQVVVPDAASVAIVNRGWIVSPDAVLASMVVLAAALVLWWSRERAMARHRKVMRQLMALAEDTLSASTPAEIARTVEEGIPAALGTAASRLYLHSPESNTLEGVPQDGSPADQISITSPIGGMATAVALCFRNGAMLVVRDTRSSPLFNEDQNPLPPSAVFAPMLARNEVLGVLRMTFAHQRDVPKDEQAAIQHLANQIATSLRLQEQKVMREQLLRSEKMAATGQLISGIAAELRVPLQAIKTVSEDLAAQEPAGARELQAVSAEAKRASEILTRLVSFATSDTQMQPVDVATMLNELADLRRREWAARSIQAHVAIGSEPLRVLAVPNQLEQVLFNLMVYAESALEGRAERRLDITAHPLKDSVGVSIVFSDGGSSDGTPRVGAGLEVYQAIMQTLGGEIRLLQATPQGSRLEVTLPAHQPEERPSAARPAAAKPVRQLTALIVEPELTTQRRLMALLAARGHRSVPVSTADDGLDLSHRLHFDVVFCAVRLDGLNWVEFQKKVKRNVPAFVLVSDGFDPSLSRSFRPGEAFMVGRVLDPEEVERVLVNIESRQEAASARR